MNSPYAIVEYNISQGKDQHTLSGLELATLIEEIIEAVKDDRKNGTFVFTSKYRRLIEELRKS
jgi:hypothetical protein